MGIGIPALPVKKGKLDPKLHQSRFFSSKFGRIWVDTRDIGNFYHAYFSSLFSFLLQIFSMPCFFILALVSC